MIAGSSRGIISRASRALAYLVPTKTWKVRNRIPIISFTFDDIDDSAFTNGASILEAHAARGTFYVAAGLCGTKHGPWKFATADRVLDLHARGHEIGCHTYSHADVQSLKGSEIEHEIGTNREYFAKLDSRIRLNNFAYPYGSVGLPQKRIVQSWFHCCRGVRQGINAGLIDLGQLRSFRLYDALLDRKRITELIASTARDKVWLIFYTHEVSDNPSDQGCSPALLDLALTITRRVGCHCLPIREALAIMGFAGNDVGLAHNTQIPLNAPLNS